MSFSSALGTAQNKRAYGRDDYDAKGPSRWLSISNLRCATLEH